MDMMTLDDKGKKRTIGSFVLDDLDDTVKFITEDGREYSQQEFIDAFNDSYPLPNGTRISLDNPKEYFENLPERFTGQIWVEK